MAQRLTSKQGDFARLVASGVKPSRAAMLAGYQTPNVDGSKLMRHPRVLAEVRAKRQALIDGDLTSLALDTMRSLMTDAKHTPAATRYKAAEWTLRAGGYGAKAEDERSQNKDLTEMSADELAATISSGMQALQDLAGQLDGTHIVDGEARSLKHVPAAPEDEPDIEDAGFLD